MLEFTIIVGIAGILGALFTGLQLLTQRRALRFGRSKRARDESMKGAIATDADLWRCGIYEYPPLSCWPEDLTEEPFGPFVELARAIGDRLGKTLRFENFTYNDFYGPPERVVDIVVGMFETPKRAERMVFSVPIYGIGLQGVCRKDQTIDIRMGLREGKLRAVDYSGEVGWEYLNRYYPHLRTTHRATLEKGQQLDAMALLTRERKPYDIVIMDELSCVNFLREGDHKRRFRLAFNHPPKRYDACVAIRSTHEKLLNQINEAIIQVRNSESYRRSEQAALVGFEDVIEPLSLRPMSNAKPGAGGAAFANV